MAFSLYSATVPTFRRILTSIDGVMTKGKAFMAESELNESDVVGLRLIDDMLPFNFQVMSVAHHSAGALRGVQSGEFGPPQMQDLDYDGLQSLVQSSIEDLDEFTEEIVNSFEGNNVVFKMGGMEIPFTAEGFLMSFSLPNFYFHATTTYDLLRMKGAPLGKRDFLGQLDIRR